MTDQGPGLGGQAIDARTFWKALGVKPSAVAVVTAQGADGPSGFLALSVAHLAADPPTLTVSIDLRTSTLAAIRDAGHFAVNYLKKGDEALADTFGGRTDAHGADRFEASRWATMTTGAPVLADAVGVFDCALEETIERHGAVIAIGRLVDYAGRDGDPLLFFRGSYQ